MSWTREAEEAFQERAAIMEYDAGMSREEAEFRAEERVAREWSRRGIRLRRSDDARRLAAWIPRQ